MAGPPAPELDAAVTLRAARIGHGRRSAVSDATASAITGQRVLVVGPNGAGKSTLIATLAGLLPRLGGAVHVLGLDPLGARRTLHRTIGHLGHGDPFYPELTGRENLLLQARLRGLGRAEVEAGLHALEMTTDAARRVADYSHGMRRRLGLAKAILGQPRLLLLDEPDDGLDAAGRSALPRLLAGPAGTTVILSTHHPETYAGWAQRVWRLEGGKLHEEPAGGIG